MLHRPQTVLQHLVLVLDSRFLTLELLDLLALSLSGRLSCLTVAENALDASLLFLIFGLCAFAKSRISIVEDMFGLVAFSIPRWKVCLRGR